MRTILFDGLFNRVCRRTKKFDALGTTVIIEAVCTKDIFEKALSQVIEEAKTIEELMSVKNPDSEVSKINKYAGQKKISVSSDTLEVIKTAIEINKKTIGAFDIRIGPLTQIFSVFKNTGKSPDDKVIDVSLENSKSGEINLDEKNKTVFLTSAKMSIDLSSIYKGFALDRFERILKSYQIADAVIKVGDNIKSMKPTSKKPRIFDVKSQLKDKNQVVGTLNVTNGAVFISQKLFNFSKDTDFNSSFVIDPKTGRQTNSEYESVIVVCENAMIAQALSTALLIIGTNGSEKILQSFDAQALFIKSNSNVYCSDSLKNDFKLL